MTTTAQWINRTYQSNDIDPVLQLLQECMGSDSHGAQKPVWLWKHHASPFGPSYVRMAQDQTGALLGMRAFMRWEFRVGERIIKAVRAVDTATHPSCRRMGIFSTLTKTMVADVEAEGTDLVFNTPNEYSLPGYLKLGWDQVAVVHPLIKVLNYPGFTLGLARSRLSKSRPHPHSPDQFFGEPPVSMGTVLENGAEIEKLLKQEQQWRDQEGGIRTHRSGDFLRWRYAHHPTIPYWAVTARDSEGLQGCAIFRTNTRYGLKEVVLSELVLAKPREEVACHLLDRLRSSLRADYLVGYFPRESFHRRVLGHWGFHAVPREGMNFTVRPLVNNLSLDPRRLESWRLAMGDLELF